MIGGPLFLCLSASVSRPKHVISNAPAKPGVEAWPQATAAGGASGLDGGERGARFGRSGSKRARPVGENDAGLGASKHGLTASPCITPP